MPTIELPSRSTAPYPLDFDYSRPVWFDRNRNFDDRKFNAGELYIPKGSTYELQTNPGQRFENPFDLRNLRVINPDYVLAAIKDLEANAENGKPSLCFMATGGTIAAVPKEEGLVPELDTGFLLHYSGAHLEDKWNVASIQLPKMIDSSQMRLDYDDDVVIAVSYIYKKLSDSVKKNFRGFVVTHGTDTLDQSGERIAMMLGPNIDFSVGVVGAMAGQHNPNNDIAENVKRAVLSLDLLYARGINAVFAYMGGSSGMAMNPPDIKKISDTKPKGFESYGAPYIFDADFSGDEDIEDMKERLDLPFHMPYKLARHPQLDPFQPIIVRGTDNSETFQAKMDVNLDKLKKNVRDTLTRDTSSVFFLTYGSFTYHLDQFYTVKNIANALGVETFALNPVPMGKVTHRYSQTVEMLKAGAIPVHMLPEAARFKLMLARQIYGNDRDKIRAFMTRNNYIGEQPSSWSPVPAIDGVEMREMGQPRETIPSTVLDIYPK